MTEILTDISKVNINFLNNISELENEIAKLRYELAMVDEALARRPALDKYQTRYDKICAACEKAQEAENIRR